MESWKVDKWMSLVAAKLNSCFQKYALFHEIATTDNYCLYRVQIYSKVLMSEVPNEFIRIRWQQFHCRPLCFKRRFHSFQSVRRVQHMKSINLDCLQFPIFHFLPWGNFEMICDFIDRNAQNQHRNLNKQVEVNERNPIFHQKPLTI